MLIAATTLTILDIQPGVNLWAITLNLICTAKHGTFSKALENIFQYQRILWEVFSIT